MDNLQRRLAEHLWTEHKWDRTANWQSVARSERLADWHGLEHETGAGQEWAGWEEHDHNDTDLEATAR